jgi:thermitase
MKKKAARRKHVSRKNTSSFRVNFITVIFISVLIAVFLVKGYMDKAPSQLVAGASSPNEVIIKYKSETPEAEKEKVRKARKAKVKEKINQIHIEVMKLEEGDTASAIKEYKKNPNVEYAEPNFIAQSSLVTREAALSTQWGLFTIQAASESAQSAWDITQGSKSVRIAILDTGISDIPRDFSQKVVRSQNFSDSPTVLDQHGHGSHVAGIAGAKNNNNVAIASVGYNSMLLNGKILGDNGSGYYSWMINGIVWAADQGAQVINISAGGPSESQALLDAVNYAWGKNTVIVAAAGNYSSNTPHYPAYYDNVIAVAATDKNDVKASFSNWGTWVDVAAPGVSISSIYYKGMNSWTWMSGTSQATPHVAGTAGLVWATGICQTNICVREQIEKTADPVVGTGTQWTWGRLNAYKAVATNNPVGGDTTGGTPSKGNGKNR